MGEDLEYIPSNSRAGLVMRIDIGQNDVEIRAPNGDIYDVLIDEQGAPHLIKVGVTPYVVSIDDNREITKGNKQCQ